MISESAKFARAAANTSATAGAGGDNTAVTGATIDRAAYGYPTECAVLIPYTATLASGKKLFLKNTYIEHSANANMSGPANYVVFEDANGSSVAEGGANGTTETGCYSKGVSIGGCHRYIRLKFTPDLDATGTDTAALSAALVLDGLQYQD